MSAHPPNTTEAETVKNEGSTACRYQGREGYVHPDQAARKQMN